MSGNMAVLLPFFQYRDQIDLPDIQDFLQLPTDFFVPLVEFGQKIVQHEPIGHFVLLGGVQGVLQTLDDDRQRIFVGIKGFYQQGINLLYDEVLYNVDEIVLLRFEVMVKSALGEGELVQNIVKTGVVIAFGVEDLEAFSTEAVHGFSSFEGHFHKTWVWTVGSVANIPRKVSNPKN